MYKKRDTELVSGEMPYPPHRIRVRENRREILDTEPRDGFTFRAAMNLAALFVVAPMPINPQEATHTIAPYTA